MFNEHIICITEQMSLQVFALLIVQTRSSLCITSLTACSHFIPTSLPPIISRGKGRHKM